MAKFKVGDKVKYVGRKYGAPYGKILTIVKEPDSIGRYIVRWDSDHKGFMAVGSEGFATEAELTAANSRAANADEWIGKTVEVKGVYWLTMGAVKAGTKFKVVEKNPNGGYDLKNLSGGAGMKGVFPKLMVVSNAARSRNAVVQKALNAVARNGAMAALDSSEKSKIKSIASGMPCSFMDGGDSLSGVIKHSKRPFLYIDFDVSKSEIGGKPYYEWYVHAWNRTRKWERNGGQYKIEDAVSAAAQAMRGAKQMIEKWSGGIPLNAQTSILRETAVNGKFKVGDRVIGELRTPSSVGTVVRVEKFRLMKVKFDEDGTIFTVDQNKFVPYTNSSRTTNAVVAKALNARRVARNFTPQSEFEVGDVVRFRDSVRSVPHDETYTVVKVSGNNVTIKGGRDNSTSVEFKNNLETA